MGVFLGFCEINTTLSGSILTRNGGTPADSAALPTFRVYGPQGLMNSGTGTLAYKDSNTISGATNASPIVLTSAGHGLSSGTSVTIAGVGGNTAANGTFTVTVVDGNTFSLNGSAGNGAYTSGGTWHVTGLYNLSLSVSAANGYASATTYTVLVSGTVNSAAYADLYTFGVT